MHGTPPHRAVVLPHGSPIPLSPDSVFFQSQDMMPPKPIILTTALADIKLPGQAG